MRACASRQFIEPRGGAVGGLVVAAAVVDVAAAVAAASVVASAVVATWVPTGERDSRNLWGSEKESDEAKPCKREDREGKRDI